MILTSRFVPYSAIAIYPFIFVRRSELQQNEVLIHHEKIHHRQQLELLLVPFYIAYLINYLVNLIRYREHFKAYKEIVFEREAYAMESDLSYLKTRKLFAFIHYF